MPEIYVTLFDSLFLPQGLALYTSLCRHSHPFRLYVVCLDHSLYNFILKLQYPDIYPLLLSDFETPLLQSLASSRSRAEYCWTLTPHSIDWVFTLDPSFDRVTYLDADTFLLKSPKSILDDFDYSDKSFLVTEHAYAPDMDQTLTSGRFCVQFITVKKGSGLAPLHWWRNKCIDQCSSSPTNGLFGDQTYLEELCYLFENDVLNLSNDPRFLGPWNTSIYRYSDAVIYHFQGFRILPFKKFLLCKSSLIPQPVISYVYMPYIQLLKELEQIHFGQGFLLRAQQSLTFSLFLRILFSLILSPLFTILSKLKRLALIAS